MPKKNPKVDSDLSKMFLIEISVQMRIFATHKLLVIIDEKDHQSQKLYKIGIFHFAY